MIGSREGRTGLNEYIMLEEALQTEFGKFLCWPQYNMDEAEKRISQLRKLGVQAISPGGPHRIFGTPVLGKGHSGIVIKAYYEGLDVALKVRRTDADRKTMNREAEYITHANKWKVGPKLYGYSHDFIIMELIKGQYVDDWVTNNLDKPEAVKKAIKSLLDIAWRLDQSGLDHGELTRIKRHYIVTPDGPRVIDFESASQKRRPSNLTSTVQSLYFNYRFSQILDRSFYLPEKEKIIKSLKIYKTNPTCQNFLKIVEICGTLPPK
jgi:putative serine/threonine protein kinase